ncbi:DUF922 domain-containing protein [Neotamlana laminarinivorans]|uniref:DUF922 domain-containing protein n=1 Tax=Neotamlana laminarinivorans TaxID=2883124 RepID=A0A9X1I1C0_9FLAO|nr:DUF922 domain-containing protein [Tamlana laminarinivorans]MCB4799988.1 DUF922 domain-containing protein [Tamlana laminarinivorans]
MLNRLFIASFLFLCNYQDQPVKSWKADYKLIWADFKGKPNPNHSAVAVTASGITFGFSITETNTNKVVDFNAEVYAHFYPEQSWYAPNRANAHVLGHEQLHFNITELFARKFRQRISKLKKSNNIRRELKTLHNTINKELAQFQNKYDTETDFSRNFEAQLKWEKYIEAELKELEDFAIIE